MSTEERRKGRDSKPRPPTGRCHTAWLALRATATAAVHHRCITRAAFDGRLRHHPRGRTRMAQPNHAILAKNPAYGSAKETCSNAGVSIWACITGSRLLNEERSLKCMELLSDQRWPGVAAGGLAERRQRAIAPTVARAGRLPGSCGRVWRRTLPRSAYTALPRAPGRRARARSSATSGRWHRGRWPGSSAPA
jgi:hypothetical protein